jgi:peptide/nickel transport system permease protein
MLTFIIRRALQMIPIILGVSLLVFVLFTSVGEDPVRVALGNHATPEAIADLRAKWGLDQPVYIQYLNFLKQIVTFDFGESFNTGESLNDMFARGGAVSLALTVPPYFAGLAINLCIAIMIAYYRGSWLDRYSTFVFVAGMSISYLVYIMTFQYIFAFKLDLFPINGFMPGIEGIQYLILPWIIIMVVSAGPDIRVFRTVFLDETKADYVRTAFAKGCTPRRVLFKHILKNAMVAVITYTVINIPFLILGAFLMERFFSIPGIGDVMINAIQNGDFPVLKGLTVVIAIAYSFFNLVTDVLYAYVDPRVQLN